MNCRSLLAITFLTLGNAPQATASPLFIVGAALTYITGTNIGATYHKKKALAQIDPRKMPIPKTDSVYVGIRNVGLDRWEIYLESVIPEKPYKSRIVPCYSKEITKHDPSMSTKMYLSFMRLEQGILLGDALEKAERELEGFGDDTKLSLNNVALFCFEIKS